jgi:hypothetical protein
MRADVLWSISGAAGICLLMLAAIPEELWQQDVSVCLWRNLWGLECLGCGMTRALSKALHGDWTEAMRLNALVAVVLPALGALAAGAPAIRVARLLQDRVGQL